MGSYDTGSYNAGTPSMMAPYAQPQSVIGSGIDATQPVMQHAPMMQHSPTQGSSQMVKPVVGAIETMNSAFPGN